MGTNKDSQISNDRRKWQKIFNAVVHMLQTQQIQLESLVKERKLLEDRIQIQHDRWVSDVHLLEEQVSQMKTDVSQAELYRMLEAAKSDLVVGLKLRESFFYKQKLGCTETDLKDLKLWVDYLTHKLSEQKGGSQEKIEEIGRGGGGDNYPKSLENTEEEEWRRSKILEGEVRKIKRAHEKLISEKESEVSALLAERNFVWNQFKKMESDYNSLLKSKHVEVKQANEKIEKLLTHMEQLQSSNSEKDETILKLRKKLSKLDAETDKGSKEISTLSRELELLRKSRSASVTPVLNRCMIESSTCSLESKSNGRERRPPVKKELAGSHTYDIMKESEKGCRSSKRRGVEAIPISETPRLFSSTFKVPKLKNSSSLARVS